MDDLDSESSKTYTEVATEARREYDAEVASLEEIDDKALRTVRTAVIVVGFVASAFGIAGPEGATVLSVWELAMTSGAMMALLAAIVLGIGTATMTEYPSGIGHTYRDAMISNSEHANLQYTGLNDQYGKMIEEVVAEVEQNQELLDTVQVSLALAVFLLTTASGSLVIRVSLPLGPELAAIGSITVFTLALYAAGRLTTWNT